MTMLLANGERSMYGSFVNEHDAVFEEAIFQEEVKSSRTMTLKLAVLMVGLATVAVFAFGVGRDTAFDSPSADADVRRLSEWDRSSMMDSRPKNAAAPAVPAAEAARLAAELARGDALDAAKKAPKASAPKRRLAAPAKKVAAAPVDLAAQLRAAFPDPPVAQDSEKQPAAKPEVPERRLSEWDRSSMMDSRPKNAAAPAVPAAEVSRLAAELARGDALDAAKKAPKPEVPKRRLNEWAAAEAADSKPAKTAAPAVGRRTSEADATAAAPSKTVEHEKEAAELFKEMNARPLPSMDAPDQNTKRNARRMAAKTEAEAKNAKHSGARKRMDRPEKAKKHKLGGVPRSKAYADAHRRR